MASSADAAGAVPAPVIETPKPVALRFHLPIPEILLALAFVVTGLCIGRVFGLPVSLPARSSLAFTGMGNLVPALVVAAGLIITFLTQRAARALYLATVLVSYGAILIIHFNIKLWAHAINPAIWDSEFQQVDELLRPAIDGSLAVRRMLALVIGPIDWLYLFAFLAMFGCSIIVHSSRSFMVFRKAVLTAMLVHVLGGLSYLAMPALGPFIYEHGANALESHRQMFMLGAYNASLPGGIPWFAKEGPQFLAAGLGAMPSLHVASSAVFIYYAWRHERHLSWLYLPLFAFIIIEAIATRWHYLVDIVAGLGLTALAICVVEYTFRKWFPDMNADVYRPS
jgi:hypothetical protein